MRAFVIALALLLVGSVPAHADPITAAITGVAAWYASIGVVGQLAVQIGVGLLLSAASYGIQYLLSGSGKRIDSAQDRPSVLIPERDGLLTKRRIYGTQVVAGGVFYQRTATDTGKAGPNIYVLGVALSEGICDSLLSVIINGVQCRIDSSGLPLDAPWNDGSNTYFKVSFRSGTDSQALDSIIAARFPTEDTNFRQRGICTAVIEMNFGLSSDHHTSLWGAGGIPQLGFEVKGLWLYDVRNPAHDPADKSTWAWSANATLVEADYMNCAMGFGIDFADFDTTSLTTSANYDDEWVPTLSGLERRGTINGEVASSERNVDVLDAMRQQNRAVIARSQGQYSIRSDQPADPVASIHQGLLVGDLSYSNEPPTRNAINRIVTQFYPAVRFNQSTEIAYEDSGYIAADGQTLEQRVSLRFCNSSSTAQRLAFALISENRVGRTLTGVFDIAVLFAAGKSNRLLQAGDTVWLEMRSPYDTISGLYKVNSIEIGGDFTVSVSMSGTTADIINGWNTGLEQALAA